MNSTISTVFILASLMMGEGAVMTDCGMQAVGHVALNRSEGGIDSYLGEGFNGWAQPDDRAIRLAREVLQEPDFTYGALYALSKDDVHNLGVPPGDLVFENGSWEVHLYYVWPKKGKRDDKRYVDPEGERPEIIQRSGRY